MMFDDNQKEILQLVNKKDRMKFYNKYIKENKTRRSALLLKALKKSIVDVEYIYSSYEDSYNTKEEVFNKIKYWIPMFENISIVTNKGIFKLYKNTLYFEGTEIKYIKDILKSAKIDTEKYDLNIVINLINRHIK